MPDSLEDKALWTRVEQLNRFGQSATIILFTEEELLAA